MGEGPLPPLYGRAPGRPKKMRKRSATEVEQERKSLRKKREEEGRLTMVDTIIKGDTL